MWGSHPNALRLVLCSVLCACFANLAVQTPSCGKGYQDSFAVPLLFHLVDIVAGFVGEACIEDLQARPASRVSAGVTFALSVIQQMAIYKYLHKQTPLLIRMKKIIFYSSFY